MIVTMMETAEPSIREDSPTSVCALRHRAASRSMFVEPKMRSVLVIIADVIVHQSPQMAFIQNNQMVEDDTAISRSRCSRFCSCQSTQKPQGSAGIGGHTVNASIKSIYFRSISIVFNKLWNLFWEQRTGGSNPSAPTSLVL